MYWNVNSGDLSWWDYRLFSLFSFVLSIAFFFFRFLVLIYINLRKKKIPSIIKGNACQLPGIYHELDRWKQYGDGCCSTLVPSAPCLLQSGASASPSCFACLISLNSVLLQMLLLLPRMFALSMPGPKPSWLHAPEPKHASSGSLW